MGVFALALRAPSNTPIARKFKTLPNTFAARFTLLLTAAHKTWAEQGRLAVEREMRPLVRDYTEMLLLTGMRHGTEAMGC